MSGQAKVDAALIKLISPPLQRVELTVREREVLKLLADGLSSKEIGKRLFIGTKTVETHRQRVMDKLELHSIAHLTKYAVRQGITSLDGYE